MFLNLGYHTEKLQLNTCSRFIFAFKAKTEEDVLLDHFLVSLEKGKQFPLLTLSIARIWEFFNTPAKEIEILHHPSQPRVIIDSPIFVREIIDSIISARKRKANNAVAYG